MIVARPTLSGSIGPHEPDNNEFLFWDDGMPFVVVSSNDDFVYWDDGLPFGGED